jgi:ribokinase
VLAVVIGNIGLDETFSLAALPQPGETLVAHAATADLGGKGANQAVLLARCGVPTRLVARIGDDAAAAFVRARLRAEPLDASGLIRVPAPTDRSIVLVAADGENSIVSTGDCARGVSEAEVSAALQAAGPDDVVLLQGNLTEAVTARALRLARSRGLRTVFNPAPVSAGFARLWEFVDLAVLNRVEARQLAGTDDTREAACRIFAAGARRVVVTLGRDGALLCDAGGVTTVAAAPTLVRDTTGAGDTFVAVLAAALMIREMPRQHALLAAARAAAITVSRPGTLAAFPTQAELAEILHT